MSMQPPPGQGADGAGASPAPPSAPPSQAPANPAQMMLAQMFQAIKRLAATDPRMSAGLQKAAQGIQEAQTALLTGGQNPSPQQSPPQ